MSVYADCWASRTELDGFPRACIDTEASASHARRSRIAITAGRMQSGRFLPAGRDALHKLTSRITKVIGIEDLNGKGMVRNPTLSVPCPT
jgi:hypothetical protein